MPSGVKGGKQVAMPPQVLAGVACGDFALFVGSQP